MAAYYNDNEPYVVGWLRNLILCGLIADGEVDGRSIKEVQPDDLRDFTQCHFFAGIGGWSYALRLAGWPDDRAVWTGSCPCQPFSTAGARKGFADKRHLWPDWYWLIKECCPPVVFGEQVAKAHLWLRLVRSDLEALDYAVGAMPIEAASVGAIYPRDRYWFVAHADDNCQSAEPIYAEASRPRQIAGDIDGAGLQVSRPFQDGKNGIEGRRMPASDTWWATEPGVDCVVHGLPDRVGRISAFGNAIVPQVAAEFIAAAMECRP